MPHRNPLVLGCAYGEASRKAQENKGENRGSALRGRGPQTLQSHQGRDNRQAQKGLVSCLQRLVGETPTSDGRRDRCHTTKVVQSTVVERERPLVHVAHRVLRGVVGVGALPGPLVEVPKGFNRVGVNVAPHVLTRTVVDGVVVVIRAKADIRSGLVGVERCARLHPVTNARLDFPGRHRIEHRRHQRTAALNRAVNGNFVGSTGPVNLALAVGKVHVLPKAADVGLVSLDGARQLLKRPACHGKTNPVVHEPRRLLRHPKGTGQLVGRDAVLGVGDQPNGRKPLVKANRRILKDGSDLDGELTLARLALPNLARGQERGLVVVAAGAARDSVSPSQALYKLEATLGVREVTDRLDEGVWQFWSRVLHGNIFPNGCDIYSFGTSKCSK